MGEKREQVIEWTVGPGEYEIKEERGSGVTIGKRYEVRDEEPAPGPGEYKYFIDKGHGGWTIAEKRYEEIEQTPGPGDFDPKDQVIQKHTGAALFSKSKTTKEQKVDDDEAHLGPGYYRHHLIQEKSKGFTMGKKAKDVDV